MKNKNKWIQVFLLLFIMIAILCSSKQFQIFLRGEATDEYEAGTKPSFLAIMNEDSNKKKRKSAEEMQETEKVKKVVFTGDSRFVGMSQLKECEEVVLAEVGEGYNYFCLLQDSIKSEEADTLVIGFGVNDLYHVEDYVDYINEKPFGDIDVYFLTVNPVDEEKESSYGYSITNEDISDFNDYILENADSYKVIDTNSYLTSDGFSTKDGLHYDNETYLKIYNYVMKEIR